MLESAAARVGTLRLRTGAADGLRLRLAVERQLAGLELPTPGLPPAAVLVIRRLADPRPGGLGALESFWPQPEWEAAARGRVAELSRRAAWPERGEPASEAPAVAFTDRASLVACLATDVVRGVAATHWWWRRAHLLLPELERLPAGPDDVAPLLVALAPEAPAILTRLVRLGTAGDVVRRLSERQAGEVARAVAHAFRLPRGLETGPETAPRGDGEGEPGPSSGPRPRAVSAIGRLARAARRERAPWARWVPDAAEARGLSDRQHWLLGVCLGLQAAPAIVRAPSFAARSGRWWRARAALASLRERTDAGPETESGGQAAPGAERSPGGARAARDALERRHVSAEGDPAAAGLVPPGSAASGSPRKEAGGRAAESLELATPRERDGETFEAGAPPEALGPAGPELDADLGHSLREAHGAELFETGLGGVLYLIAALRDLGLPAAFDRGWRIPSRLGTWGTLDLIARALLGEAFEGLAGDPIWSALAKLRGEVERPAPEPAASGSSGRRDPLRGWDGAPAYRAPRSWCARLEVSAPAFRWAASRWRLWLWSEAGYLVASVARRGQRPGRQAASELAAYRGAAGARPRRARLAQAPLAPVARPAGGSEAAGPAVLLRWAAAVAPAVRRRLLLALGRAGRAPDPVRRLLTVRAELYLTSSHVDLVADLDQAWLPARVAGLDRDPGWLPDYGRVVLFHFE